MRHASGDSAFGICRVGLCYVAQTACHRCHVDRRITTADHHHAFTHMLQTSVVKGFQESGRGDHIRCRAIGDRQRATRLSAHTQKHCVKLFANLIQCNVSSYASLQTCFHAQIQNALNFRIQYIAWRTESGNTITHHAAQEFMFVKYGDVVPFHYQLVSTGQACRSTAEQGNFFT